MLKNVFISILAISLLACSGNKRAVDLIVHHAKIYSVDSAFTVYEAMAIQAGRVVELNTSAEILKKYKAAQEVDLAGQTVMPGFIDAHCHFLGYGLGLGKVNLVGTNSLAEVLERTAAYAKKTNPGRDDKNIELKNTLNNSWLQGRGWDQNDWKDKRMPDNRGLDSLFPDRPVFLMRIDGHAALANTAALKRAGITLKTKIAGGEILTDNGRLTGVLVDNAVDLVKAKIPETSQEEIASALLNAQDNCLSFGLTTVDDAGLMYKDVAVIDSLHQQKQLKLRLYVMLSDSLPNYQKYLKTGPYKTDRLNVCSFKFYADGALGSRGACLKEDYADKKNWRGFMLSRQKHFEEKAREIAASGFQMCTHCIGDSAYKLIINAYRKAGVTRERRWRIEHAQVVDPEEMQLSDGIVPSVQPTHATSDMYWVKERLGEQRSGYAYAYKTLLKAAGVVALGTDFPVEDISPFKTFYAAVARRDAKGFPAGGFQMENALDRMEALKGMTLWAAYANFEEKEKGSLEAGKLADFIVLSKDIMECELPDVLTTSVLATYINGERVYQSISQKQKSLNK